MDALATTLSPRNVVTTGSGASCPLAIALVATNASIRVGAPMQITWTVASSGASEDSDSSTTIVGSNSSSNTGARVISNKPFVITHSAIHACARRNASALVEASAACDPFGAEFQSANVSAVQHANVSSLSRNGSFTFHSSGEVAFSTAGEYVLAAYVVVSGGVDTNQRQDFVVYTAVSVLLEDTIVGAIADADTGSSSSSGGVGGNSTSTGSTINKKSKLPFNLSLGQFIVMCVMCALVLGCAVAVVVLSMKRKINARKKEKERTKGSHTSGLSPITGESGQFRFSDWSEIYATQDALPDSILVDDSNTIAILRASRVSSPTHSAHVERRVADFTRDVGYWDVRPSASPITPLSSFFFPSTSSLGDADDVVLASPTDNFVSLETLGRRRTRPCYADALDDRGLADDDDGRHSEDDEQEVEF